LWSHSVSVAPRGLALAREKGWLLAWDDHGWLYLFNRQGERQAQRKAGGQLAAACCADDGSAYAAVGGKGEVWWLTPDLSPRWEKKVPAPALAVAVDSLGQYLAVADAGSHLHVFDRHGRVVSQSQTARPLHHLHFVSQIPMLLGAADYGLVLGVHLNGQVLWRDGLVAYIGSLAASGDARQTVVACFSEGLRCYDGAGQSRGCLPVTEPCSLAALAFDGSELLAAPLNGGLLRLDLQTSAVSTFPLDKPAHALALHALGSELVVAPPGGPLTALDLRGTAPR
jgi:hypothetical protein